MPLLLPSPAAPAAPPTRRPLPVLEAIDIASPCPADWKAMAAVPGHDAGRVRHCGECGLNVYHISGMTRREAVTLVGARQTAGERLCVRLYRRGDGTVLMQDCSRLRRAARITSAGARRLAWLAACGAAAVVGATVFASELMMARAQRGSQPSFVESGLDRLAQIRPFDRMLSWLRPNSGGGGMTVGVMAPRFVMGDIEMGTPSPIQGFAPVPQPMPRDPSSLLQASSEKPLPL